MSTAEEVFFAHLLAADDNVFLTTVLEYLQKGGKDLMTICSSSKIMSERCNQFKDIIEQYKYGPSQPNWREVREDLVVAIQTRNENMVRRIMTWGSKGFLRYLGEVDRRLSGFATRYGSLEYLKPWISEDPSRLLNRLVEVAANSGHLHIMDFFISLGIDLSAIPRITSQAAQGANTETLQYLLDHGVSVHHENDSALITAAENTNIRVMQFLLDRGADIHAQNDRALHQAIAHSYGEPNAVRFLLDHGADLHARDDLAIQIALRKGENEIVQLLLSRGANPMKGQRTDAIMID